jgi:hypothetical protein
MRFSLEFGTAYGNGQKDSDHGQQRFPSGASSHGVLL